MRDSGSLARCRERVRVRDICAARLSVAPHIWKLGKFGPSPAARGRASASPDLRARQRVGKTDSKESEGLAWTGYSLSRISVLTDGKRETRKGFRKGYN